MRAGKAVAGVKRPATASPDDEAAIIARQAAKAKARAEMLFEKERAKWLGGGVEPRSNREAAHPESVCCRSSVVAALLLL